ncbi:neuropeptide SIFamide receptor-like [Stylophora pistillata]|uniref:neuropeptide SIFamide receptor-like n=1 Tax=Stylophora pistillata TaxID=50429 RepID=UPI000C0508D9|nr:neuropeptide SIFamide receptor-like [Stylophora pistillata]
MTSCISTEDPVAAKVSKTFAYCLLLVVSLIGNTLIIMVVYRDKKMKTTTNLLIVNMAISDLLVPIFAMPRANVEIIFGNHRWLVDGTFGEALCKLTAFFQDISTLVSVQTLVAIALDRFYAVWFPLKALRIKPRVKYVILLIWSISTVIHAPYLYGFQIRTFDNSKTYCFLGWSGDVTKIVFLALITLIYVIPLLLITIFYGLIVRKLRKQTLYGVRNLVVHFSRREKRNRNVLKMSLAIVVVFFVSMSPFVVYLSIELFSPEGSVCLSKNFRFVTQYLVHCNGALNFFTYFIFNQSYRHGFLMILSRVFCASSYRCRWKKEVELTSPSIGRESHTVTRGTINQGMDLDQKDVVLIQLRSLHETECREGTNGNIDNI